MSHYFQNITSQITRRIIASKIFFIIFYIVGTLGTASAVTRDLFISLTPLALLLSFLAVIIYHNSFNYSKELIIFTSISIAGFLIEAVGVKTGRIFGNYTYGEGLGIKILNTPLMIGINWGLLVYCTAAIVERFQIHAVFKILISSSVMVIYDVIMEQAAPVMDMWSFEGGSVPVRNYTSWFLLAVIFHSIVKLTGIRTVNRIAPFILYIQALFFIVLITYFKLTR
jgi:putative membrane protein